MTSGRCGRRQSRWTQWGEVNVENVVVSDRPIHSVVERLASKEINPVQSVDIDRGWREGEVAESLHGKISHRQKPIFESDSVKLDDASGRGQNIVVVVFITLHIGEVASDNVCKLVPIKDGRRPVDELRQGWWSHGHHSQSYQIQLDRLLLFQGGTVVKNVHFEVIPTNRGSLVDSEREGGDVCVCEEFEVEGEQTVAKIITAQDVNRVVVVQYLDGGAVFHVVRERSRHRAPIGYGVKLEHKVMTIPTSNVVHVSESVGLYRASPPVSWQDAHRLQRGRRDGEGQDLVLRHSIRS